MEAFSIRAPESATTFTNKDDDIYAAWERFSSNRLAIPELDDQSPDYDEQEARLWDAIETDEAFIGNAIASTLLGAELQLWCILTHEADAESEPFALRCDLSHFDTHGGGLDWSPKLALQAIRSLRAIQEGGAA